MAMSFPSRHQVSLEDIKNLRSLVSSVQFVGSTYPLYPQGTKEELASSTQERPLIIIKVNKEEYGNNHCIQERNTPPQTLKGNPYKEITMYTLSMMLKDSRRCLRARLVRKYPALSWITLITPLLATALPVLTSHYV